VIDGIAGPARRARTMRTAFAALLVGVGVLGPAIPAAASPDVDPGRLGSLTIHKLRQADDPSGLPLGAGTEILPAPALDPVPGVDYLIRRVDGIDLATPGGWAAAFAVAGAFDPDDPAGSLAPYPLVDARMAQTGADGVAEFDLLPIGVYVVEETAVPVGVAPSAPFVVVLPVTDPVTHADWVYDLHVYPKAAMTAHAPPPGFITKTTPPGVHEVGDRVEWTVGGEILDGTTVGGVYHGDVLWWRIVDHLDTRLAYESVSARFVGGPACEAQPALVELHPGVNDATADFEMLIDSATNTVTFEVLGPPTTRGLARVTDNHDCTVEIVLVTRILEAVSVVNEVLINTAIWDDPIGVVNIVEGTSAPAHAEAVANPWRDLAWTGFTNLPWALAGAGLVVGGYLLLLLGRRRRRREEATA